MGHVEWVETTGKTVEEAKEAALDQLGVDEQDAEFEVIEEPRSGLFGRTRGEGRVRARVIPRAPRPKPERKRRARNDRPARSDAGNGQSDTPRDAEQAVADDDGSNAPAAKAPRQRNRSGNAKGSDRSEPNAGSQQRRESGRSATTNKERAVMDAAEQCQAVTTFLDGLGASFGLQLTSAASIDDDGVLRASIDGSEVGLFIGPGLGTLEAIQEIVRNVLQRQADGREYAKVVLDIAGVRTLRRDKLTAFTIDAARQVVDDGVDVMFEVMSSSDRKVVHDTVSEIDGVQSASVGEDLRRRVVLKPA